MDEIAEMWWAEVWNNYSIDFGLISGFVLNVEEMETVFGLRMFSLNFLVFEGLYVVRVVLNVEEELM